MEPTTPTGPAADGTTGRGRVDVLGLAIDPRSREAALDELSGWISARERRYACFATVNSVIECRRDPVARAAHGAAALTLTDGMPLTWLARRALPSAERIYGPDTMLALCERGVSRGWKHFFVGGAEGVADELARRLQQRFPGMVVAGTHSPPFRKMTPEEDASLVEAIAASGAHVVWIGLGSPKQDVFMHDHAGRIPAVMLGVGAAFDFHAGRVRQAPRWMQRSGLEWLFRLSQDPKRLWKRYLVYNTQFVLLLLARRLGFGA